MRFRKLRIAWSVAWGVVAVLLMLLWTRRYSTRYMVHARGEQCGFVAGVARGWAGAGGLPGLTAIFMVTDWEFIAGNPQGAPAMSLWRPYIKRSTENVGVYIPIWMIVVGSAGVGGLSWLRYRFSLRMLLIAITVIAVVMGIIAWLSRAG